MTNQNVDRNEIAKFEALASRWWDPTSEFKPLHDINPLRLNYIDERGSPGWQARPGCRLRWRPFVRGHGPARRPCYRYRYGRGALAVARLHGMESGVNVDYQQITVEELAQDSEHAGQYDVVTCLEMLEHVPDPASVIKACAAMLKPGGHLFVSTINRNPKSFLFAIVGAEYVLRLLPKGTHEWKKFIRPSEMSDHLRHAGLDVRELTGMTYNPITKIYKLGRDVDVNYLMHARDIREA